MYRQVSFPNAKCRLQSSAALVQFSTLDILITYTVMDTLNYVGLKKKIQAIPPH